MPNKRVTGQGDNLAFFREFLNANGSPLQKIADGMGVSKSSIFHWFKIDDMRLAQMVEVADILGFDVEVSASHDPASPAFRLRPAKDPGPQTSRLQFLTSALKECHVTKTALAEAIGLTRESLTYWYVRDDITIRNLICCLKVIGRDLNVRFIKRAVPLSLDKDRIGVRLSIEITGEWTFDRTPDRTPKSRKA